MEKVKKALKRYNREIMGLDNVVGVGRGFKDIGGQATDEPAAVILVTRKKAEKEIRVSQLVPKTLDRVRTDVIEVGDLRLLAARLGKYRPAPPGVSIGHYLITAGTFGAVVRDRKTGARLILSNNHVLANATSGQDGRAKAGDAVLQPGSYDNGSSSDVIARLERFIPLQRATAAPTCPIARRVESALNRLFGAAFPSYGVQVFRKNSTPNLIDAAVARPLADDLIQPSVLEIGEIAGIVAPEIGMRVFKSGRTTGLTESVVRTLDVTVKVELDRGDAALFSDQILLGNMSQGGDSGSLIVNEQRRAVGLLFAGSDQVTLANRIGNVLDLLEITL